MGLDMYLYKIKDVEGLNYLEVYERYHWCSESDILTSELPQSVKDGIKNPSPFSDEYRTVFNEVMYWRKFNALHGYMVEHHQDGIDECQLSKKLTIKDLKAIVKACKKDTLEPQAGFFFGNTDKDEYYQECLTETIDALSLLIKQDDGTYCYFYRSSW